MKPLAACVALLSLVFGPAIASAQEQTTTDGRPPIICRHGALTTGLLCEGSFCDDVSMRCGPNVREVRSTRWTQFVHRPGGSGIAICGTEFGSNNAFMSGIACEGDWCDNVAIRCTELELFEPDFDTCRWGPWFSEEEKHGGWQTWPSPFHFPVALECDYKDHCDLKRIRTCRLIRRD